MALKSPKGNRKEAAESLMSSLRQHSAKLIDQALLVSHELVRVAILWQEVRLTSSQSTPSPVPLTLLNNHLLLTDPNPNHNPNYNPTP